jgi:hypothetical protein
VKARFAGFLGLSLVILLSTLCTASVDAQTPPKGKLSAPTRSTVRRTTPARRATPAKQAAPASRIDFKTLTISAKLKNAIKNKARFDETRLENRLVYLRGAPFLKIKGGAKEVQLESVQAEPAIPASVQVVAAPLKSQLTRYNPYISKLHIGSAVIGGLVANTVDHRGNQTAIRDQGTRGTCVAHGAVAVLESIYKKNFNQTLDLSENHAYNVFMAHEGGTCMADPGLKTWKAAGYLTTDRICNEAQSPYINSTSTSCATIPSACNATPRPAPSSPRPSAGPVPVSPPTPITSRACWTRATIRWWASMSPAGAGSMGPPSPAWSTCRPIPTAIRPTPTAGTPCCWWATTRAATTSSSRTAGGRTSATTATST